MYFLSLSLLSFIPCILRCKHTVIQGNETPTESLHNPLLVIEKTHSFPCKLDTESAEPEGIHLQLFYIHYLWVII